MNKIDESVFEIDDEDLIKENKKRNPLKTFFYIIILCIVLTIIYSRYLGTSGLFMNENVINNSNLSDTFNGFKIVHFSDFHYGNTTSLEELKELVININNTKADIVVFTGDFVDKNYSISEQELSHIIEQLKKIECTYGKYYVEGEDDTTYDKFNKMFDSSNFINLNNAYDIIYNKNNEAILISGLAKNKNLSNIDEANKNNTFSYKINIMHYPDYFDDIEPYNYNLVLAGHSHNGQISIPFYGALYNSENAREYNKKYYKINNTDFYISSGIGTTNYKFRLFNRPSFNLYRITKNTN